MKKIHLLLLLISPVIFAQEVTTKDLEGMWVLTNFKAGDYYDLDLATQTVKISPETEKMIKEKDMDVEEVKKKIVETYGPLDGMDFTFTDGHYMLGTKEDIKGPYYFKLYTEDDIQYLYMGSNFEEEGIYNYEMRQGSEYEVSITDGVLYLTHSDGTTMVCKKLN